MYWGSAGFTSLLPHGTQNHRIIKLEKTLVIIKSNQHSPPQHREPLPPLHRHHSHLGATESREAKSLASSFVALVCTIITFHCLHGALNQQSNYHLELGLLLFY